MRITSKNKVRSRICNLPNYFDCKGDAIQALVDACSDYDIEVVVHAGLDGNDGHINYDLRPANNADVICDCCGNHSAKKVYDNWLCVSWYVLGSGRVELTAYIS